MATKSKAVVETTPTPATATAPAAYVISKVEGGKKDVSTAIIDDQLVVTFRGGDCYTFNMAGFSAAIQARCALHGLAAKLVDAAALPRDTVTGLPQTAAAKQAAVLKVLSHLEGPDGTWFATERANGEPSNELLSQALMSLYGKSREAVDAILATHTAEQIAAAKTNPVVAGKIAEIRNRGNQDKASDLLAAFSGLGEATL